MFSRIPVFAAILLTSSLTLVWGIQLACERTVNSRTQADFSKRKEAVMKLIFTRSGGFAGPATGVTGEVAFEEDAARVTSSGGYQRELSAKEVGELRDAIGKLPQAQLASDGKQRDVFQYDLQITWDDGRIVNFTVYENAPPDMQRLADWLRDECGRIWNHRITH
jgi:hypothetical protein